jgi:hypothetical protein
MVPLTRLSIAKQAGLLKSMFPMSKVLTSYSTLVWQGDIKPTPLSQIYTLKLKYELAQEPHIYVLSPKLTLAPGATKLKHVYSTKEQELCIYYPSANEWNSRMYLARTILPWASDWLQHYEYWAATGIWHGGGIDHEGEKNFE